MTPVTPNLESLGSIPLAVLAAALLGAAAWGLGGIFARLTGSYARSSAAKFCGVHLAVGLTLVAWLGIALGQSGLLAGTRSLWLLGFCALLGVPQALDVRGPRGEVSRAGVVYCRRTWIWPKGIVLALIAVTAGPALCPPTGWDELVYHHELPRRWLADGWPAFYPDLAYSGFPSLGEVLFWLVAPLESVIAPRLIAWSCWLVGLVLLHRVLRRVMAGNAAVVMTVALAASSTLLLVSANCYVESILLLFGAALLHAILVPRRLAGGGRAPVSMMLLGVLTGGAAAVKLTGGVLVVLPCCWFASEAIRQRRFAPLRALSVTLVVAAIVALPFYVRPWLATGNPCYPFLSEWFVDDAAAIEVSRYHHVLGAAAFGTRGALGFFAAPVLLVFDSGRFDGDFGLPGLGFLLLAAVPLAMLWRQPSNRRLLWLYGSCLALYVFWFASAQQARFAISAALLLVVLAAQGLQGLHGAGRKAALLALIAGTLLSLPWATAGFYVGSWFTVLGLVSRPAYVHELTDRTYAPLVQAIAENTSSTDRVLLLFEHRGFYVPRSRVIGTPFFQEAGFTPAEAFAAPDKVLALLRRKGVTHVVMTSGPAGPDWAPEWSERLRPLLGALDRAVQDGDLQLVWESERYRLVAVAED